MEKKTKKKNTRRRYGIMKAAGFAFVGILCVFAASMTSEATRRYVVDGVRYLVGDDTRIVISNDGEHEKSNGDEYAAIADIENTLGVDVPEFLHRPKYFTFYKYSINKESGVARMEYRYTDNNVILFCIDKGDENNISTIDSVPGQDVEPITISNENIEAKIKKMQEERDQIPSYNAQWERKDVIYQLFGKIELDEMKKILEKLRY